MTGPGREGEGYTPVDIDSLQGNFRKLTNPIYVPNPEDMELDQEPTLRKMLDKLHFTMLEAETELDIIKSQIIAINCAINVLVKNKESKATPPKPTS